MTITAKIIEDSISEENVRLTTMQLCYPRFIHAEFMTHRVFSRNASSSRAIPVAKMLEQVRTNPAMPIHWGKNQSGMQAHRVFTGKDEDAAIAAWKCAASSAAEIAEFMQDFGLHKQVVNRILEPFQHIHVIVTATNWDNFFELRIHPDAQPEIQELAIRMQAEMLVSVPKLLKATDWHLPYITTQEHKDHFKRDLCKISAARCARVSYLTHDGQEPNIDKDLDLYDRLITMKPAHASPIEHQARPDSTIGIEWKNPTQHGNFTGWIQFRKLVEQGLL